MTLYNKGPFLFDAIRSVLDGSYDDFELLVVDDASTDEGPEVARSFTDPRVRWMPSALNQGRAAAASRGYAAARGEYIAVLDADDITHPDRLRKQVEFLDVHPEVGVLGTAARCFGTSDEVLSWPATDHECRSRLLFTDPVLYGSSMFRSALLKDHGLTGRTDWHLPGEDYLFMLRVSRVSSFANLQEVLLDYRIGDQNQRHGRNVIHDRGELCREVFRFFGLPISDREIETQLLYHQLLAATPDRALASRFLIWHEEFKRRVRANAAIPFEGFRVEVDRRFRKVYFLMADHDLGAALLMLYRRSELRSWSTLRYLIRVTLNRWQSSMSRGAAQKVF